MRFDKSSALAAVLVERETSPADIYILDLTAGQARRLRKGLNPDISEEHLVSSEVVWFDGADGLPIPGLLYRPHQASAEHPTPAMVWIHGGPGAQSRQDYQPVIQHLVNNGYAVYAINNRGSDGYGKTFRSLDRRRHGEADLADVVASRDFLESHDWIDNGRIGVMGQSYGGYLTLAALTFAPETFDVGINIFGPSDYLHSLRTGARGLPRQAATYDEIGHPDTDQKRLRAVSPLFHAERIVRPLLVVQGENDVRVPKAHNDRLVDAIRANGGFVKYVVFEGEGHGFRRRENRIRASDLYVGFLDDHLKGIDEQDSD